MYHKKLDYVNGIRFDLSILGIEENLDDDFFTRTKKKNIEKKYGRLEFPNIDLELIFNITSEIMDIKNVSKNSEKFMIKNLDKFYEQIMDFTGYYNDKYYRAGFGDCLNLVIMSLGGNGIETK